MFEVEFDTKAFEAGVRRAVSDIETRVIPDIVGGVALRIVAGAEVRSRVDRGWYRDEWDLKINGFASEPKKPRPPKGTVLPEPNKSRYKGEARATGKGDFVGVSNPVPYAEIREYGSTTQRPDLTVTRSIQGAVRWVSKLGELDGNVIDRAV